MTWHALEDPNSPELDHLAARYGLHPLHLEDCRHRAQRAKVEENGTYLFVVLKTLQIKPDGDLLIGDLDVFLGRDYLITVPETGCPVVTERLGHLRESAQGQTASEIFYRLLDHVADTYWPLLDRLSEQIDDAEDEALGQPEPSTLRRIQTLKRQLLEVRRVLSNTRDVVSHLLREETSFVHHNEWMFVRDVYDHLMQQLDQVDLDRDTLASVMDLYVSTVAQRTNEVMKVLTVLSTIALPAVVITGYFGMNLKGMPWADRAAGFAWATALIAGTAVALLAFLRWRKWL
jgi:magnesium transporter